MEFDLETAKLLLEQSEQPAFLVEQVLIDYANPAALALQIQPGEKLNQCVIFDKPLFLPDAPSELECCVRGSFYLASLIRTKSGTLFLLKNKAFPPQTLGHTAAALRQETQMLQIALSELYTAVERGETEKAEYHFTLALHSLYSLRRTTEHLDLIQRLQDRTYRLDKTYTELDPFFRDLVREAEDLLKPMGFQIRFSSCDKAVSGWLDRCLVTVVFWNLIANAAAASKKISVSLQGTKNKRLSVQVRNRSAQSPLSLPGFYAMHRQPFFPLEGVRVPGFGMDLMRQAAELHGGTLVVSEPQKGMVETAFSAEIIPVTGILRSPPAIEFRRGQPGLVGLSGILNTEAYDPRGIL